MSSYRESGSAESEFRSLKCGTRSQPIRGRLDQTRHLGAVSCASTLALAAVLAFAAVVARLAAALAFTVVFAFTGVLGSVLAGIAQAGLGRLGRGALRRCARCGSVSRNGSANQTGESCGEQQSIELVLHLN